MLKERSQKGLVPIVLILVIVIAVGLAAGGYYFFQTSKYTPTSTYTPVMTKEVTMSATPTATASSSASKADMRTYTSKQITGLSFKPFTIQYPLDWEVASTLGGAESGGTFIVKKGEYKLAIAQSAKFSEGTKCAFDDDNLPLNDPNGYPPLSARGVEYREVKTPIGTFRLFQAEALLLPDSAMEYTSCVKASGDKYFATPSAVGEVVYGLPKNSDETTLKQLDAILATITLAQ